MSPAETWMFWLLAPVAVLGALGLLFARKAVHAAMAMALVMVVMGVFYIGQQAEFVGVIQIFVYSGAVMMLFLFVVMLVGVDASDSMVETLPGQRIWAYLLTLVFVGLGALALSGVEFGTPVGLEQVQAEGSVTALAREIFTVQLLPFEVLGVLLVIAVMGAMVLAHAERFTPRPTQADWSRRKISSNVDVAGRPVPGVYARHNAADTPALLPDGSVSEISVPRVLVAREQVTLPERYDPAAADRAARSHDAAAETDTLAAEEAATDQAGAVATGRAKEGDA